MNAWLQLRFPVGLPQAELQYRGHLGVEEARKLVQGSLTIYTGYSQVPWDLEVTPGIPDGIGSPAFALLRDVDQGDHAAEKVKVLR